MSTTRNFLPTELAVTSWEVLLPFIELLKNREIGSVEELRKWFLDRSELESIVSEDMGWRYIKMTCFTENEDYSKAFQYFVTEIQPKLAPESDALNKKALSCSFLSELEKEEGYDLMIREMKKEVALFRSENIPLFTELQTLAQEYSMVMGKMSVEHDGKELTMQQAGVLLQEQDRGLREQVYHKIAERRMTDRDQLEEIFHKMVDLRHKVALNAGFDNFRDYKFRSMGRFDYTPADCFEFHQAVAEEVVPLLDIIEDERKKALKLSDLRPWDKAVDTSGKPALKPFSNADELLKKTITCFNRLDPYFGECLETMHKMGHLDLDSRKGKAPGGYNYPLAESGVPFIFMNATSTLRDMVTLLHEGGHAVHSFLTEALELNDFKNTPSEVAELASMSMELITMDHWDVFFESEEELNRAKKEHLEQLIETLPWVACIDKFQHWIYENAQATKPERTKAWEQILSSYSDTITDWSGLEDIKKFIWHRQLHLFEVPFYYIEYGMAQLGAVAVWKNYKENSAKGLEGYKAALKLGYTRSIPQIYEAGGIHFDFSKKYIKELMAFVKTQIPNI